MVLYSTNCPKCKVVETKLKQLALDFSIIDDRDKVVEIGKAHNIMSAPILEAEGNFYDFAGAINYLKGIK